MKQQLNIVVANNKGGAGKSTLVAALAQVLDANIVDHDEQGTLRATSAISGLNKPVARDKATKKVVIHDLPPYNSFQTRQLLGEADLIIIPCNVSHSDLVAVNAIVQILTTLQKEQQAVIVFNRVRKPHNNAYRSIKANFQNNFQAIRKAKTELSQLNGFLQIFAKPLAGKAKEETAALCRELKLI